MIVMNQGDRNGSIDPLLRLGHNHVINLASRPDRYRQFVAHMSDLGSDGTSDFTLIRPQRFDDSGYFESPAVRSCLHAHLSAAGSTAADAHLVVFEDDAQFVAGHLGHLGRLVDELVAAENEWDIATLGWIDDEPVADEPTWERGFTGEVIGAHCYVVNRNYLGRWIEHLEATTVGLPGDQVRGPIPVDGAANTATWLAEPARRWLASPAVVRQRPSASDITPRPWDRLPILRPMTGRLRSWRDRLRRP